MEGLLGVFLGIIGTYYFNNLNTKKSNSYNLEREYIDNVCVTILSFLEKKGNNDSLGRQDFQEIIEFIEDIYRKNYICITEKDRIILDGIKKNITGDLNNLLKSYTVLKEYFNTQILNYRNKISGIRKNEVNISSFCKKLFSLVITSIVAMVFVLSGIAGVCGLGGWRIYFYDIYNFEEIFSYGLSFTFIEEPYLFIFIGMVFTILSIKIYKEIKGFIQIK